MVSDVVKRETVPPRAPRRWRPAVLALGVLGSLALGACASDAPPSSADEAPVDQTAAAVTSPPAIVTDGPTTTDTPIGLAFEIENGVGKPLSVRAGQKFFVNQIDIRSFLDTTVDEGIGGIRSSGDFAGLAWRGVEQVDQSPLDGQNADGTYTQRRFFRGAEWMEDEGIFVVLQVDARGRPRGVPIVLSTGSDGHPAKSDAFWDRRFRAIQWIYDCATTTVCPGSKNFQEEALVELRNSMHPEQTFRIRPETTALQVFWSARGPKPYTVPITQVAHPQWDYGFEVGVTALTPPRADGTYAPGTDITFQLALKDGAGNRLTTPGSLPKYLDAAPDPTPSGVTYYRAFFDATTTYYRRKHRERMLMSTFEGPAQLIQPSRTEIGGDQFFGPQDVQTIATVARDGYYSFFRTFPTSHDLFGGAFDPTHAAWNNVVPDTWVYTVPADAPSGTYKVATKGRRVYLGQDIPASSVVTIQVGTPTPTTTTLPTHGCNGCHDGNSSLSIVNHALADRTSCNGCHAPLAFELEGPIYVRTHFLHSRSHRYDDPLVQCKSCHVDNSSIQRTSKSACLSCHNSYPADHVQKYGPIDNMYVGSSDYSTDFGQCTSSCHTTHPGSGL